MDQPADAARRAGRLARSRVGRTLRGWGALTWLGFAWLAGPVPGFDHRGITGQPLGELWWWQLAAAGVVLVALIDALRAGEFGIRVDQATLRAWSTGRRWRTVVVTGWLALAVLAATQLPAGRASWGDVTTFTAAAAVLGFAPRRSVGGEAVPRLAVGGVVLAVAAVATFLQAASAEGLDGPYAYYLIKQQVMAPVAAHNVLAGFLLVGAPAAALAAVRRRGRWWLGLVLLGVGLAATLSRGAVVAGAVAVVVAWFGLRDRTVGWRTGAVVGLGAIGMALAFGTLGAANPDEGGSTSVVARAELWDAGMAAVAERPVAGVGLDGFLEWTRDEQGLAAPHEHAHNLPLHAAATLGISGLIATLAVWGGLAAGAYGLLDRDRRTFVLVALAGLGSLALVDEVALRPSTTGLLALLAVTVAAPRDPVVLRAAGPGIAAMSAGG